MPFIITDERNLDQALTAKEWHKIKQTGWMLVTVANLIAGEEVDSTELADDVDTMPVVSQEMQKLVAYALGGNRVRVQVEKGSSNG